MRKKWMLIVLAGLITIALSVPKTWAGDLEIIDLLKQKGILTDEEYTNIRAQFDKEQKKEQETQLKPVYQDGFKLETGNKEFSLGIDGKVFGDARFYLGDNHPNISTFSARLVRYGIKATLFKYYTFRLEGAYDEGTPSLKDAFFEAKYFPEAAFRVGQFKEPFSLDELTSDTYFDMMERALPNGLVPSRDIGAMVSGTLFDDRINYGIGGFNGNGSNQAADNNDDKDVAARIVLSPFLNQEGNILKNLHIGGAMTYGYQNSFSNDFTLKSEARTTYFKIASADKIDLENRTRWGAELAYTYGPLELSGEYIIDQFSNVHKQGTTLTNDMDIYGWYATIGYFLTGEEKAWKGGTWQNTKPKQNFDPFNGGLGALEVLFRYSRVAADEDFFKNGIVNSTKYASGAHACTAGLNWTLNPNVMVKLNYVHTKFDDDIAGGKKGQPFDNEDVIMTRFQISF